MRSSSTSDPPVDAGPAGIRRAEAWALSGAILFAAASLAVAFTAGGGAVLSHLAGLDAAILGAMLGLSLVNYLLRALRWQLFTLGLGLRVPFARNLLYYAAGFAMTTTPGKVGELIRLWFLRRWHGHGYGRGMGIAVADRLTDATAIVVLAGCGAVAFAEHAGAVGLFAVLILAGSAMLLSPRLNGPLLGLAYRLFGRWPRAFAGLRRSLSAMAGVASPPIYGAALLLSLVGWMAEVLAFHVLLQHLGVDIGLLRATFIFTFAMFVGAIAMLPGGLGGTEVSMVGLLIASGADFDTAVAATIVIRGTTLWFAVAIGFAALPFALRPPARDGAAAGSEVRG